MNFLRTTHGLVPRLATALAMTLLMMTALPGAANASPKDKQTLAAFSTGEAVAGTFSKLDRSDTGITSKIRTSAEAGHVVTIWLVIFNAPENCNANGCGEDDIFIGGVPANGFDMAQIEAARISVVFGGDGGIANPGGRVALDGGLAVGEVPTGSLPVVIGLASDGALVPGPVTGVEDARGAEVHIVLQDHGMAHTDPGQLDAQMSGFNTECNPVCEDIQFAVHMP